MAQLLIFPEGEHRMPLSFKPVEKSAPNPLRIRRQIFNDLAENNTPNKSEDRGRVLKNLFAALRRIRSKN